MIPIKDQIFICEDELVFKFSRSGGPGGQNVNKVNTRVTLLFDAAKCRSFSDVQKRRVLERLAGRVNKGGIIRVTCRSYRTQEANRKAAVERLRELLRKALETRAIRKRTTIPRQARERRLEQKRRRSLLKRQRTKEEPGGD